MISPSHGEEGFARQQRARQAQLAVAPAVSSCYKLPLLNFLASLLLPTTVHHTLSLHLCDPFCIRRAHLAPFSSSPSPSLLERRTAAACRHLQPTHIQPLSRHLLVLSSQGFYESQLRAGSACPYSLHITSQLSASLPHVELFLHLLRPYTAAKQTPNQPLLTELVLISTAEYCCILPLH